MSAKDLAHVGALLVTAADQPRTLVEIEAVNINAAPGTEPRPNQTSDREAGSTVDTRKAGFVFQLFKDTRFTGELKESIELTSRDYTVCALQHRLTASQKAEYFVKILDGLARTFFFNNASEDLSYDNIEKLMLDEYNRNARQLQNYSMLRGRRLERLI